MERPMDERVIFLERIHLESPQALQSMARVLQIGHEKATSGYERVTDPSFGYTHCVFQYTLSGMGYLSDGVRKMELPPGTGFLCSYRTSGTRYWAASNSHITPWEFVYVEFDGGNAFEATSELLHKFGPLYHLPPDLPLIASLIEAAAEQVTTRVASPLEVSSTVTQILATLCESKTLLALPKTHFLVAEAYRILSTHSDRCFSVTELADMLMVSREHLTRLFRETLSITPRECILREKVKQACSLLKATNLNSDEIGARLGYRSTQRFVKHFREGVGVLPRQYRQALLSGNDLAHKLFYRQSNTDSEE